MLLHPGIFQVWVLGVGCHFLLQRIFPTQGLNPGLPHCRQTLYHLSHQGSRRMSNSLFRYSTLEVTEHRFLLLKFGWLLTKRTVERGKTEWCKFTVEKLDKHHSARWSVTSDIVYVPLIWGLPCSSNGKESTCSAEDQGSIPGLGRSPGEGNSYPLQHSCLEPTDREAWWARVHGGHKECRYNWMTNTHMKTKVLL